MGIEYIGSCFREHDLSFHAAACERSHQINIHDKWKGSLTLVLPPLKKKKKSLGKSPREKWLCQDPFQSHNSATLSTHRPHISAATEAPSFVIPLSLSFLPTRFHFPSTLDLPQLFWPFYHHYLHPPVSLSLFLFSSLFTCPFHSAPLTTMRQMKQRCCSEW